MRGGKEFRNLPALHDTLKAGAEALRGVGLSRRKAEYILGIAKAVVKGG